MLRGAGKASCQGRSGVVVDEDIISCLLVLLMSILLFFFSFEYEGNVRFF